jgi:hypothetical protein
MPFWTTGWDSDRKPIIRYLITVLCGKARQFRVGRVGASAVHDHGAYAVVALRNIHNQLKHFLLATHVFP